MNLHVKAFECYHLTDIHTYIQTEAFEIVDRAASQVVNNSHLLSLLTLR